MPLTSQVGRAPVALERGVPVLADQRGDAELRPELGLVERQLGELVALPVLERPHGVVEAGDLDFARLASLQAARIVAEGVERVRDRAAVGAGVQVRFGPVTLISK